MSASVSRIVGLLRPLEAWRDHIYDDRSPWPRTEVRSPDECELRGGQFKVKATGGTATIAWGETAAEFVGRYWGRRITQAEAEPQLVKRVQGFLEGVQGCIDVPLTDHQWEAVTCRAYQTGVGGFCRSETAELLNSGDFAGAVERWRAEFAHPDRSRVEIAHFLTPDERSTMTRFYSRAEWGARAPGGRSAAPGMTRGIGVHYLGEGRGPTGGLADSMAKMREVQAFHTGPARGWSDFAYNWAADMYGNAFEGRGNRIRNAANGGGIRHGYDANAGWLSVIYLNGTGGPDLTDAAKDAINDIAIQAGVEHGEWLGHRDFLSTACPGDQTYNWVHGGHPYGTTGPTEPIPEPEDDDMSLFIYDHVKDNGDHAGTFYADGYTKWGVDGEEMLAFWTTGKVHHLGAKPTSFHRKLRWRDEGRPDTASLALGEDEFGLVWIEDEGHRTVLGPLATAVNLAPSIETGDPGCAGLLSTGG